MGFLGKMVAKAVVKKAETAAIYGVVSHMENTRSVDALVNKSTANYMLFIKKKSMSIKRGFTVYAPKALHPKATVTSGVLGEECRQLMQSFFRQKR